MRCTSRKDSTVVPMVFMLKFVFAMGKETFDVPASLFETNFTSQTKLVLVKPCYILICNIYSRFAVRDDSKDSES